VSSALLLFVLPSPVVVLPQCTSHTIPGSWASLGTQQIQDGMQSWLCVAVRGMSLAAVQVRSLFALFVTALSCV
jgi:hypothetical protein